MPALAGLRQQLPLHAPRDGLGPGLDRALFEGSWSCRGRLVLVDDRQVAEAVALGAGALRAVEGKEVGEGFLRGDPAGLALELVRKPNSRPSSVRTLTLPSPFLSADLERIDKALAVLGVDGQPVDEDVEGFFLGRPAPVEVDDLAVTDEPEKPSFLSGAVPFSAARRRR